jgi:membrane protein
MPKRPQPLRVVRELYARWCSHRGGALASDLLVFVILGLLPLVLALTALLGAARRIVGIEASAALEEWVQLQAAKVLGESTPVADTIAGLFAAPSGRTVTVSLVVAVIAASRGFVSFVGSLDVIYGTSSERSWLGQRLVGFALSLLGLVAVPAAVTLTAASRSFAASITSSAWQPLVRAGIGGFGYALAVLWIATCYRLAPKRKLTWTSQLPGAVLAVVLAAALTRLFRLYLATFTENAVFGLLGAVVSLFAWGYVASCAVILGAEVNAYRLERRAP